MSPAIEFDVVGGRLRVVGFERLGDVNLDEFKFGNVRLAVLAPPDEMLSDPFCSYLAEKALGPRGFLSSLRVGLPALVLDLAPVADTISRWLTEGNTVTVACNQPLPVALVAAVVLMATGQSPVRAIATVELALPGSLQSVEEDIALSRARDHLLSHRDLRRRRAELVAQGRSPWEAR